MRNILALIIILRAVATCTAATMATEGYVNARAASSAHSATQYVNSVVSAIKSDRLSAGSNPFFTAVLSADDGRVDVYRHIVTSVPGDPPAMSTQTVHIARLATTNELPSFLADYVTTNQLSAAVSPSSISGIISGLGYVGNDDYGITWDDGDLKLYRTAATHADDSVASWLDVTTSSATTLQASKDYTHQYVLDTFIDADLATRQGVMIEIGFHNTNDSAHADIRAEISNKADKADAVMYQSLQNVSASGTATVNLGGSRPTLVTLTSNATLGVTGLYPYYPAYLMVQGNYSWGFSNATYWVGGAWYQTNRANHYVVWTVGTNLYVNPVTTSEVLP